MVGLRSLIAKTIQPFFVCSMKSADSAMYLQRAKLGLIKGVTKK